MLHNLTLHPGTESAGWHPAADVGAFCGDAATWIDNAWRQSGVQALRRARVDRISGEGATCDVGPSLRPPSVRPHPFAIEPEMFLQDEPSTDPDPAVSHAILAGAGTAVSVLVSAARIGGMRAGPRLLPAA